MCSPQKKMPAANEKPDSRVGEIVLSSILMGIPMVGRPVVSSCVCLAIQVRFLEKKLKNQRNKIDKIETNSKFSLEFHSINYI